MNVTMGKIQTIVGAQGKGNRRHPRPGKAPQEKGISVRLSAEKKSTLEEAVTSTNVYAPTNTAPKHIKQNWRDWKEKR